MTGEERLGGLNAGSDGGQSTADQLAQRDPLRPSLLASGVIEILRQQYGGPMHVELMIYGCGYVKS